MKKTSLLLVSIAVGVICLLTSCTKKDEVSLKELKTLKDSASYAMGYLSGLQAKQANKADLDADVFTRAFKQGFSGDTVGTISRDECYSVLGKYARNQDEINEKAIINKARPNLAAAENFLNENSNKKGVVTTVSGLQYKVIKQGKGIKPKAEHGDRINFLYSLSVLSQDGKMNEIYSDFKNSNSKPHLIGVDNFIKGFTEAVQMMNKGSRYIVWIHPDLGYGMQDSPEIPAGSLLMFDIKVVDVIEGDE